MTHNRTLTLSSLLLMGALSLSAETVAGLPLHTKKLNPKTVRIWAGDHVSSTATVAFTTYLTQSIVMTAIFYGWGLGFYNRMSPMGDLVLGSAFFILQIGISVWWLRCFRFGSAEWLWRYLTYAKMQPFKLDCAVGHVPAASLMTTIQDHRSA